MNSFGNVKILEARLSCNMYIRPKIQFSGRMPSVFRANYQSIKVTYYSFHFKIESTLVCTPSFHIIKVSISQIRYPFFAGNNMKCDFIISLIIVKFICDSRLMNFFILRTLYLKTDISIMTSMEILITFNSSYFSRWFENRVRLIHL